MRAVSQLMASSLADTLRLTPLLMPALLGFVATAALAVMVAAVLPRTAGTALGLLIVFAGGSYFTLQTYALALRAKQAAPPVPQQALLKKLHRQILAVWAGYLGWWLVFASVLTLVAFLIKMADTNLVWLVSWVPEGPGRGLALLGILIGVRAVFFWMFETQNAFLGLAKMSGGRDMAFARSLIAGQGLGVALALFIAALPLLAAASFFGVLDLFTLNALGMTFVTNLPPSIAVFLGLILGYSFVLSVFVRLNAFLGARHR